MTQYAVVDLETTGHSQTEDRVIEIGIVLIDDQEIVDQFTTLFHPNRSIPSFIEQLTGIKEEDLEDAPAFSEQAKKIYSLINNRYFIAHNVPFDLGFLNAELQAHGFPFFQPKVIDTVELARMMFPRANGFSLNQLANDLHIQHDEPHRALADALATAQLFLKMKEKLDGLPNETIKQLLTLEKDFHSDLRPLLYEALQAPVCENDYQVFQGIAYKKIKANKAQKNPSPLPSFGHYLDDIYEEDGRLAEKMVGYEKRPGQRTMSEEIHAHFQMNKHALIEAETGIGKSLAYLLPAIYEAWIKNEPIVISTLTTSLQTQLITEEIPFVQKIAPFPFSAALLKGKGNYLSIERFAQSLQSEQKDNYDQMLTKAIILIWMMETETGDVDEIHLPASGYDYFKHISARTESILNPQSQWYERSYYRTAYENAEQADLIITNHALLTIDFLNDYKILPSYEKVIIDEAHHLERIATRNEGLKMNYVSMVNSLNEMNPTSYQYLWEQMNAQHKKAKNHAFSEWMEQYHETVEALDDLFTNLYQYVLQAKSNEQQFSDVGRIQYRVTEENNNRWQVIQELAHRLIASLQSLSNFFTTILFFIEEDHPFLIYDYVDCHKIIETIETDIEHIEHFFWEHKTENTVVKWLEIDAYGAKNSVYLYSESADVSTLLQDVFFAKKKSIILTSATLAIGESFSFVKKQLGIPSEEASTYQIKSTFSYEDQVQLFIPNDFPHVDAEDFVYATCEAILSLAEITKGRLLVLFTSYEMLRKAHRILREMIQYDEFMLIAQGVSSGSRSRLKKDFQSFDQAILLGTSSFWEGVDIPGDDLSSLVIVRLPFQPPSHPVLKAKAQELEALGGNSFMELALPQAVLKFKQGFGRLIRSTSDRGIIFVCDQRIYEARYGHFFTRSIPDVPTTYDMTSSLMKKAEKWF